MGTKENHSGPQKVTLARVITAMVIEIFSQILIHVSSTFAWSVVLQNLSVLLKYQQYRLNSLTILFILD